MQRFAGLTAAVASSALCAAALANSHKEAPMIPAASAPATAQQAKTSECDRKAAGKTGDARAAFMKSCLAADAPVSPQDKTRK